MGETERLIVGQILRKFEEDCFEYFEKKFSTFLTFCFHIFPFGDVYCYVSNVLTNRNIMLKNVSSDTSQKSKYLSAKAQ